MQISMPVDAEANELLTRSPLALLIAMLLDQQVPLERAFSAPRDLVKRLGREPTAEELADFNPEQLAAVFGERPALHRFPKAMAARTQELAKLIVTDYGGEPTAIWTTASSGAELLQANRGAARLWRAEGEDLRRAARQAARRPAAGLAGGGRAVRRGGVAPVGGGHLRRRVAGRGALVQGGAEGGKEIATPRQR